MLVKCGIARTGAVVRGRVDGRARFPVRRDIASLLWRGELSSWNQRWRSGWRACRPLTSPTRRFYIDLLSEQGPLLGEPYTKQLDRKLRELRFHLDRGAVRITYWIATDRRIILLTVFHKTRMRDEREIDRARRALARCIDEAHEVVDEEG